jgi:aryl-alcohol dehydrogenase-like predicted oxidoreductase
VTGLSSSKTRFEKSRLVCRGYGGALRSQVETLKGLQTEGKVRFIGMSGIMPNLFDHIGMGVFDVFQFRIRWVQRDQEELITEAADVGAGTFIRGGAARCATSDGKNWRTGPQSQEASLGQHNWETSGIADLLSEAAMGYMKFVLRFTLRYPGLSTTIVGMSNPVHLANNIAPRKRPALCRPLRRSQEAPPALGSPLTRNQP